MRGIYKITNKQNGKVYIGSSKNITYRWEQHIGSLIGGYHHSYKLQQDWDKYGIQNFTFEILEVASYGEDILDKEQYWIDYYESYEDTKGYNVTDHTKNKYISKGQQNIKDFHLCDNIDNVTKEKLKKNLNVLKHSINDVGEDKFALSKSWFQKDYKRVHKLKNYIYNYFNNIIDAPSKTIYWTALISFQGKLKGKGYVKGFVPLNGTVDTKRNNLCFALNPFINPFLKRSFEAENVKIDDDKYSLSIMLRWIIAVSDIDKPINIYIPSSRMRELLNNWLYN